MKYKFQHYVDIQTSATSMNIITIKAGGSYVFERCKHLFGAYKYFKLGPVKVKLLPASTLPVDPLGLSYQDDDPLTIDPRDQMNPGLVRITNGENIQTNLDGVSGDVQQLMYTNTMLDPRWSKFMLQSGFQRSAIPLFWDVAMPNQSQFPDSHRQLPVIPTYTSTPEITAVNQTDSRAGSKANSVAAASNIDIFNNDHYDGLFQVGHRTKMGYLPTDGLEKFAATERVDAQTGTLKSVHIPLNARIPSTDLITIVLPKAYKTIYYYRLFITETVYFSGLKNVGIQYPFDIEGQTLSLEHAGIDNFTRVTPPVPTKPSDFSGNIWKYPYEK